MKRHQILLGATTTTGGVVVTATSYTSLNGVRYALEGDMIDCPACAGRGTIQCAGPRMIVTCNGRHYALEDDLCACQCQPPPRLIARQAFCSQHADTTTFARHAQTAWANENRRQTSGLSKQEFDEQTRLTAAAIAGLPFFIETSNGRTLSGRLGADGLLPRIGTIEEDEYTVYWGDVALSKKAE